MSDVPVTWSDEIEKMAKATAGQVGQTLVELREQRQLGRPGAVDRLAGCVEKLSRAANSLTVTAARIREAEEAMAREQVRLAQGQAELLSAVIVAFVEALGLDVDGAMRPVLRGLLRQARNGGELGVSVEESEALRHEVRQLFARELIEWGEVERVSGPKLLSAPAAPHPDGAAAEAAERDEMAGPRTTVRAVGDEGIVEGEVVDAPSRRARGAGGQGWSAARVARWRKTVWREVGELEGL